jgi:microcystin-dependent protein
MIGAIYMYAGSTVPNKFMVCDGSAISRSTYSDLFDVIGTVYGEGDGVSTFNVPNLSGRIAIGSSSSYNIGATGGSETCTLVSDELPTHLHEVPQHGHTNSITVSTPELSHTITQPTVTYNNPGGSITDGNYSGATGYGSTTTAFATRMRNVSISDHDSVDCSGSLTIENSTAFNSGTTGSGNAHNNMQPYVTMAYIIQVSE